MPTPHKRAQRARRELRNDAVVEDLSPSRPAKRRKKVKVAPASAPLHRASPIPVVIVSFAPFCGPLVAHVKSLDPAAAFEAFSSCS